MAGLLGAGCHDVPGWSGVLCGWGGVVSGLGYNGSWGISDWCAAGRGHALPPSGELFGNSCGEWYISCL